jgi:hypothetical protein
MLYVWEDLRKLKIEEIELYKNTYLERIAPVFDSVEKEADNLSAKIYDDAMSDVVDDYSMPDPSSIAQFAMESGFYYYEKYSLMRYNTRAMWITMLYQYWEQQVRKFLYDEYKNVYEIEFSKFCSNGIREIKEGFKESNLDITLLNSWSGIEELRLLANSLKHGEGSSTKQLKEKFPKYFEHEGLEEYDLLKLYNTTLGEKVLNINDSDYSTLCDNLIAFWKELDDIVE